MVNIFGRVATNVTVKNTCAHNKSIIFVTDDVKSDWFLSAQENNGHARPRPELVQEMFVEAGVLFHVYQGYEFLDQATGFLKLTPEPGISADAKEVTEQNTREFNQVKHGITMGMLKAYEAAENAVLEWLQLTYSNSPIIRNLMDPPDFTIIEPDGTRIGIEVKYRSSPYSMSDITGLFGLAHIRPKGQPHDKFMIIIVCRDVDYASTLTERIKQEIEIPRDISLVIGYLDSDRKFCLFSILP